MASGQTRHTGHWCPDNETSNVTQRVSQIYVTLGPTRDTVEQRRMHVLAEMVLTKNSPLAPSVCVSVV